MQKISSPSGVSRHVARGVRVTFATNLERLVIVAEYAGGAGVDLSPSSVKTILYEIQSIRSHAMLRAADRCT
jgi:hypothetical protein